MMNQLDLPTIIETWLQQIKIKSWEIYQHENESFLQPGGIRPGLNDSCHLNVKERHIVKCCNNTYANRPEIEVGHILDASDPDFFKKLEVWLMEEWPHAKRK